jgi:cell division initiation protein
MKITPIEIRQKSFEKAFRGYEKEEVDAFLYSLSQEWEKVMEENKELKRRLDTSEKEVNRLRDVENSLFKTIKTAETTGASVVEHAQKAADLHLREAQIRAEGVLNEARTRAKNMIEEAEEKVREIMYDIQEEVNAIVKEYHQIEDQKEYLLQSLQTVAQEVSEKVERARGRSNRKQFDKRLKDIKDLSVERKSVEFDISKRDESVNLKLKNEPLRQQQVPLIKPESPASQEQFPVRKDVSQVPKVENPVKNPGTPAVSVQPEKKIEQRDPEENAGNSFFDNL